MSLQEQTVHIKQFTSLLVVRHFKEVGDFPCTRMWLNMCKGGWVGGLSRVDRGSRKEVKAFVPGSK